jgi:thioredoxin 1
MKLEVLKFYANWCGPCKILTQRLEDVKNLTEINIEENHETAIKYKIRNIPALVFLKDDVEVHRSVGLITKYEYDQILNEINTDTAKVNDIEVKEPEVVDNFKKEK